MRVLLLGGTAEARLLAERLQGCAGLEPVSSLAGRTRTPRLPPGEVRIGGFGGIEGLRAFLRTGGFRAVVDATHPFAGRITLHAMKATAALGLPYLRLERPPWKPGPGDRWISAPDLDTALDLLPGRPCRIFVNLARRELPKLADLRHHRWILRTVDPVHGILPAHVLPVHGRPPYTAAGDRVLLQRLRIDWLLVRNSGGEGAYPKLVAARELGLPVVMVERPCPFAHPAVATVEEAYRWLLRLRAGRSR